MTVGPKCILHPRTTGTVLSIHIVPFGFEQSDHLQMQEVPGDHKLYSLIDYLPSVTSVCGMAVMKRSYKILLHSNQISLVK